MTLRQKQVLNCIIQEYRQEAAPVSSFLISAKYIFNVSPATIRNEMGFLERDGYLQNLHTSSGRIPTDKGFRFFVNSLMQEKQFTSYEKKKLKNYFLQAKKKNKRAVKALSNFLSAISGNLAIASMEDEIAETGFALLLKEPEFSERENVLKIAEFLDSILDSINDWLKNFFIARDIKKTEDVQIYIGQEMPTINDLEISILISKIFSIKEEGIIILIGPKRMQYEKNISLLEYTRELLI